MTALVWLWGVIGLAVGCVALMPLARRWVEELDSTERGLILFPLTFGLSIGGQTLWLLAAGFWQVSAYTALAWLALAAAVWLAAKAPPRLALPTPGAIWAQLARPGTTAWAFVFGLGALVLVLGQATYYPFIGEDEISRYAYYARLIVTHGQVTSAVRGYPMLMPLAYANVFLLTGIRPEQLARLIPVLFSLATVLATAALAYRWFGKRGAVGAAMLLVATPLYLKWSDDGYVDIPSALYFVLAAHTADLWFQSRRAKWALLSGALTGLALWTKQAGFAVLPTLGVIFALAIFLALRHQDIPAAVRHTRDGLLALVAAFAAGGFWYVRNIYYDGLANAVPGPGALYTEQAVRDVWHVIPFVGEYAAFGALASAVYIAALLWGVARLQRASVWWSLLWCLPYTLLWWQQFSYDPRFLLTVLPFYAILAGGMISEAPTPRTAGARWAVVALVAVGVAASELASELGGLRQWITAPTATYAERLIRAKGDLYPTVEFIRDHLPPEAKIISMDGRLSYYLIDRNIVVTYPFTRAELQQFDYLVLGAWWREVYSSPAFGLNNSELKETFGADAGIEALFAVPGEQLAVYRILKP